VAVIKFKLSVVALNTHHNGADYYGPARATMIAAPAPANITYLDGCIARARADGLGDAAGHIIVFPEFVLQPQEGAYTTVQRGHLLTHLGNILGGLGTDTLLVFGTIVSEDGAGHYYNEMPYGIGGGGLLQTGKLLLSNIDLIDQTGMAGTNVIFWNGGRLSQGQGLGAARHWDQLAGASHTLAFKGAQFGFSVCLDYDAGVLAARIGPAQVNVHVVTSCGMAFRNREFGQVDHNATLPKGAVVICDADGAQSSVHRIKLGGTSFHRSTMKTTTYTIGGVQTKIRAARFQIET
jgi:predicted amidohydrolase